MIVQTQTTSFKRELFCGFHAFDSEFRAADTFFIALYNAPIILDNTTTAYTALSEVVGIGYTAGGQQVFPTAPAASGFTAYLSFASVQWINASFVTNCALIYNQTQNNRSVCVLSFGNNKTAYMSTPFVIQMPLATPTSALLGYK